MSSAEATTKACSLCLDGAPNMMPAGPEIFHQIDGLRQEVTRLKCDKLDLLRQNVVSKNFVRFFIVFNLQIFSHIFQTCQRDIKRLRERELSLQGDLAAAGKEILRLRDLLKEYVPQQPNGPHSMSQL